MAKDIVPEDKPIPAHFLLGNMGPTNLGQRPPDPCAGNVRIVRYDFQRQLTLRAREHRCHQPVRCAVAKASSRHSALNNCRQPSGIAHRFAKPVDRITMLRFAHASAWDIDSLKKMCASEDASTLT